MVLKICEKDLLEQDPTIRGQTYACVSFLSPEDIIKHKDTFYFENFVQHFSKQLNTFFEGVEKNAEEKEIVFSSDTIRSIKEQYEYLLNPNKIGEELKNFISNNQIVLDKEFNNKYDFQTNVRGIKIRGVYESLNEAQLRCEHLRKLDNDKFSIYVCEVGCWCPWSPNPDHIKNQEYAIDSLNTMMHEYDKNIESKNEHYAERKEDLKKRIKNNEKAKIAEDENENDNDQDYIKIVNDDEIPTNVEDKADKLAKSYDLTDINVISESLSTDDNWMLNKNIN
jgi:hypothetical protein